MKRFGIALLAAVVLVGVVSAYTGSAAQGYPVLVAAMNGDKEVSSEGEQGVGDQDGTGSARITLKSDMAEVCFRLRWRNIAAPTMAHVHEGGPNQSGPPVVTLFAQDNPLPATLLSVGGCVDDVDAALINRIRRNPDDFYVNVHNSDFPGGAIRGQLRKPRG